MLDKLQDVLDGEKTTVREVVEHLGDKSFASLMLIFSLIAASPASAIPGITAIVAALVFMLVVQIIIGREHLWLPQFILDRRMSSATLRKGTDWLRKPVKFVERFLKPRLRFLLHPPWEYVSLILVLALTVFMPFMEVVPTSGSIAAAIIALYAIGRLTGDGAFVLAATMLLSAVPFALYYFGFF
ncbi:MAG: exopolysaccharide biosynthesis protein [Pontixanthobacter sp.]